MSIKLLKAFTGRKSFWFVVVLVVAGLFFAISLLP